METHPLARNDVLLGHFDVRKRYGCIIDKKECDEDEISSTEFVGTSCLSIVGVIVEMMPSETQRDANYCR